MRSTLITLNLLPCKEDTLLFISEYFRKKRKEKKIIPKLVDLGPDDVDVFITAFWCVLIGES